MIKFFFISTLTSFIVGVLAQYLQPMVAGVIGDMAYGYILGVIHAAFVCFIIFWTFRN